MLASSTKVISRVRLIAKLRFPANIINNYFVYFQLTSVPVFTFCKKIN